MSRSGVKYWGAKRRSFSRPLQIPYVRILNKRLQTVLLIYFFHWIQRTMLCIKRQWSITHRINQNYRVLAKYAALLDRFSSTHTSQRHQPIDADIAASEAGDSDALQLMRLQPDRSCTTASRDSVSPNPTHTHTHVPCLVGAIWQLRTFGLSAGCDSNRCCGLALARRSATTNRTTCQCLGVRSNGRVVLRSQCIYMWFMQYANVRTTHALKLRLSIIKYVCGVNNLSTYKHVR